MALQNESAEYIVVESVTPSNVTIRFHKDKEHRARYKTWAEDKYECTRQENRSVPVDLKGLVDPTKNIWDNNILAGYEALKGMDEFANCIDI